MCVYGCVDVHVNPCAINFTQTHSILYTYMYTDPPPPPPINKQHRDTHSFCLWTAHEARAGLLQIPTLSLLGASTTCIHGGVGVDLNMEHGRLGHLFSCTPQQHTMRNMHTIYSNTLTTWIDTDVHVYTYIHTCIHTNAMYSCMRTSISLGEFTVYLYYSGA